MRIVLYLSALVILAVVATWAYRVNYATQAALARVDELQARIRAEREAIAVLEAEWAYLNRPERLRSLVELYSNVLGLEPLAPEQFGEAAMVPFPPEEEVPHVTGGGMQ